MGETLISPLFEEKPELDPSRRVELAPVDRFARLKEVLLTEGRTPLVSADIAGMEDKFREVMMGRGFVFEVIPPEKSGGGKSYEKQRPNLVIALRGGGIGEARVRVLEAWGELLFETVGRKTHDDSTGEVGIVVAQVVLDLYRFAAGLRTQNEPNTNQQRALETTTKLNKRVANWHSSAKEIKNPSGCSGDIMARVIDWMLTGEMTVSENY